MQGKEYTYVILYTSCSYTLPSVSLSFLLFQVNCRFFITAAPCVLFRKVSSTIVIPCFKTDKRKGGEGEIGKKNKLYSILTRLNCFYDFIRHIVNSDKVGYSTYYPVPNILPSIQMHPLFETKCACFMISILCQHFVYIGEKVYIYNNNREIK